MDNFENIHVDSLNKRYLFKLSSSFLMIPISMVTAAIIPRMLGPDNYGNFHFLIYTFTQIISFIGSGNNFFATRLAENLNDYGLKRFYWNFVILSSGLIIICFIIASSIGINNVILPGQNMQYIWMAILLVLGLFFSNIIRLMIDIYGLTIRGEITFILSKILALIILVIIYLSNWHSLSSVFVYNYFIVIFIILGLLRILKKNDISVYPTKKNSPKKTKAYISAFYEYSFPLYTFASVGLFIDYLRRWLLQYFGGSIEQGYFSISNTISSFIIMFSSAIAPLLLREFSISMGKGDFKRISSLFKRFIPMFYSIAAYFSIFIMLQSSKVTMFIGGEEFNNAIIPVAIMALYPIYYTTNNIIYALLFSTRKTKLYRNIGVTIKVIGLPFTFFLLAPKKYFGLDSGATGFAIGMLLFTFLSYNIYLWFSTRYLQISFRNLFLHQFFSTSLFAIVGFLSINVSNILFDGLILSFVISGIIYTTCTVALIYFFPKLFHITLDEIIKLVDLLHFDGHPKKS